MRLARKPLVKSQALFVTAIVGMLQLAACTKQETPEPRTPQETGKPTTEEPEGNHSSASPRNDVDNSPDASPDTDAPHTDQNPIPHGAARSSGN
jgi:hypothetical protein